MATQDITPKVDNPPIAATSAVSTPIATGVTAPVRPGLSLAELIYEAETNPPQPILEGLIHENEIVGLHGTQEAFKTMFCLQLAEALATGDWFFGAWKATRSYNVFFLETEMSVTAMGKRARKMYGQKVPSGLFFANEKELRQFRRAPNLSAKMALLEEWLSRYKASGTEIDVVIIDTANPFFRGKQSANEETVVGEFFDRFASLPVKLKLFVRHNRKRRGDNGGHDVDEDAQSQRGSGQFADVPDLLLQMKRPDKRVDSAEIEITKFRHGSKPEPMRVWFDKVEYRLIPYPPLVHILRGGPRSRDEVIAGLKAHFSMGHNGVETNLKTAKESGLITETPSGHRKLLSVDWNKARKRPDEGDYWYERYERIWGVGYKKQEDSNSPASCTVPQNPQTGSEGKALEDNKLQAAQRNAELDQNTGEDTSSNICDTPTAVSSLEVKPLAWEEAMRKAEERSKEWQAETDQKIRNMVAGWKPGERHDFLSIQAEAEQFGLSRSSNVLSETLQLAAKQGLVRLDGTVYWRAGEDA
jgi:AAA domain